MGVSYPVTLKSFRGGRVGAFFADVPEAITAGTNEAEALDRAQDALLVASFRLFLFSTLTMNRNYFSSRQRWRHRGCGHL